MTPDIVVAHCSGSVREGIAGILQRRGHRVDIADNAATALPLLKAGGVDLLLVGLSLPPSGYAALLSLCEAPPPAVVIGLEGSAVPDAVTRDPRLCGVLARPYSLAELEGVIDRAIRPRRGRPPRVSG